MPGSVSISKGWPPLRGTSHHFPGMLSSKAICFVWSFKPSKYCRTLPGCKDSGAWWKMHLHKHSQCCILLFMKGGGPISDKRVLAAWKKVYTIGNKPVLIMKEKGSLGQYGRSGWIDKAQTLCPVSGSLKESLQLHEPICVLLKFCDTKWLYQRATSSRIPYE